MFEQDYVMRMIKEIARVLAKILFHADSETIEEELTCRKSGGMSYGYKFECCYCTKGFNVSSKNKFRNQKSG